MFCVFGLRVGCFLRGFGLWFFGVGVGEFFAVRLFVVFSLLENVDVGVGWFWCLWFFVWECF